MDISDKIKELWEQLMEAVKAAAEYAEQIIKDALVDAALYRDTPEYSYIRKICPIVRVPQADRAPVRRCNPP